MPDPTQTTGAPTPYGFTWGPCEVIRASSDPKHGVWLIIRRGKQEVTIRATNSGLLRVGCVENHLVAVVSAEKS